MRNAWLLAAAALALVVAARMVWPVGQTAAPPAAQSPHAPAAVSTLAPAVQSALDAARIDQRHSVLRAVERTQLADVYRAHGWAPLWLDANGTPTTDARTALDQLERAFEDGLDPQDYGVTALSARASTLQSLAASPADAAAFDVDLTAGLQLYLRDLHVGRVDPRAIGFKMTTAPDDHDFAEEVRRAVAERRVAKLTEQWAPQFAVYRNLRTALATYRVLAADPALAAPPARSGTVGPGDTHDGIDALARVLVAVGDLQPEAVPAPGARAYDGAIVAAVTRFQVRHGLEADGVLGRATQDALGVPLTWRSRQLELALERLRWLPHLGTGRLIAVNVPMFRLWAWDALTPDGLPSFETRVIVGKALDTETPVFVEQMEHVIFRPYWNIPRSILQGEILPALARDPTSLDRQNMEIVGTTRGEARPVATTDKTLAQLRQGGLGVRQRPGPTNSLGRVKFVFPNDENVYLHDTPAPALFQRSRRDFSHGCVRVQDPAGLAAWVLRGQDGWTPERVAEAMKGDATQQVNLREPLRVVLFYITAVVTPQDGAVHFAEDIYGHDGRLDQALARRPGSVADRLPGPDAAGIDVDEIRRRVVAHAPAPDVQRGRAQLRQRHVVQADIDGLSYHVQAVGRHALATLAQPAVGRRRTVARDYLERPVRAGALGQAVEQIQERRIDHMLVARAEIA